MQKVTLFNSLDDFCAQNRPFWCISEWCIPLYLQGGWINTCRKNKQDNKQEENNIKHDILQPFWVTQVSLDYSKYGFAACNYTLIEINRCYCEGKWPRDASVRCYVTGSLRARGVNQQRHVSKGASPAHSSEVALRRSNLQNNASPGFTSQHQTSRFHVARSVI